MSNKVTETGSSTKQLKPVLGFGDLMGVAVGQIIGAGLMTLLGSAIAMTGRSIPLAFLISSILILVQYLPLIFVSGTVRVRGGSYTMVAMLTGQQMAGFSALIFFFTQISIAMYALSFADYFATLFNIGAVKIIALVVLTLFFLLNCFGIEKFAKVQNIIVILMVVALGVFAAFGVGKVQSDYLTNGWMTNGSLGLFQAGALLTFAMGGAQNVVNLSAEAKNPTRDVPLSMLVSTFAVAVIYGIIAIVAAGVLPVEQVAGQNLAVVAQKILNTPLYVFFMVCGAGFALISTLNAQFAWAPKPIMQACDDGWFPASLAKLSKYNTPVRILSIIYGIGVVCIVSGVEISMLANMTVIAQSVSGMLITASVWRIGKVCPEAWSNSKFKVSMPILIIVSVLSTLAALLNAVLNASTLPVYLIVLNVVVLVLCLAFGFARSKNAHVDVSYEKN